jgi:hypothetical protein
MKLVLTPYWIAEECFLQEAIIWAGFYRYPKSEIIPDRVDIRFDQDAQEEFEPHTPDWHGYIESDEAVRVGLPPNPEWESLFNDEDTYLSDPATIERLLELDLEEAEKEKLRQELVKSKKRAEIQAGWNKKYEAYMELIESKFFVALREGKIKAVGRKLPHHDLETATGILDGKEKRWSWFDMEHEDIPANFWRLDRIEWNQSSAENGESHYFHIYVKTDELMDAFPAPDGEDARSVSLVAGQYILDDSQAIKIKKTSKRGRPSLDWDTFFLELAGRIKNDDLPEKQEAFIAEMQDWCLEHWGQKVGRSTLLQKISPFYQRYVTK